MCLRIVLIAKVLVEQLDVDQELARIKICWCCIQNQYSLISFYLTVFRQQFDADPQDNQCSGFLTPDWTTVLSKECMFDVSHDSCIVTWQVITEGRGNFVEEEVAREIPGRVTNSQFEAGDNIATEQPVRVSEPEIVEEAAPVAAREVPIEAPAPVQEVTHVQEVTPVEEVQPQATGPRLTSAPIFGKTYHVLALA